MAHPVTVHLVDASPYIFRAFFSLPSSMTDPHGRPIGAVYGFLGFLIKLCADEAVTHLGVAFDESLTTCFRNEIFADYKAHREPPPDELRAQLADCQRVAAAFGAVTWADLRYEADDLVASAAASLGDSAGRVVVVSGDKDLSQLVDDRVELFDFARGVRWRAAEVVAKFGVTPRQIPDYLALAGDAVDNIPGVQGVGGKTAAALLSEFDDLEAIYADLDRVAQLPLRGASSVARKLAAGRASAELSKRLATLVATVPLEIEAERLAWSGVMRSELEPLLAELGFETVLDRVPLRAPD